jgi:hypothetical protein
MAEYTSNDILPASDIQDAIDAAAGGINFLRNVDAIEDMNNIVNPTAGSYVFVEDNQTSYIYSNDTWTALTSFVNNGLTCTTDTVTLGGDITTNTITTNTITTNTITTNTITTNTTITNNTQLPNEQIFMTPGITYREYDTTAPIHNDYLVWDGDQTTWSLSSLSISKFSLFGNDFISIDESGKVLVEGNETDNPTKIGIALLKAINKIVDNEKIESFDDI